MINKKEQKPKPSKQLVKPEFPKLTAEEITDTTLILRRARYMAMKSMPYFSVGLLSLQIRVTNDACYPIEKFDENGKPVDLKDPTGKPISKPESCVFETEDAWYIGTAMIDKSYRTYVHPMAVQKWIKEAGEISKENPCKTCGKNSHHKYAYIAGILVHEMGHPMRRHHARAKQFEHYVDPKGVEFPFQRDIYNIAIDLELNDNIQATAKSLAPEVNNFCIPHWVCFVEHFNEVPGMAPDLLAEEYYRLFMDNPNKKVMKGRMAPSCGSGADGQARECDESGEGSEGFDGLTESEADIVGRQVAESVRNHAGSNPGKLPAGLVKWADLLLGPSKVSWKTELHKMVRYLTNRSTVGCGINTYAQLSRISTILNHEIILPSTKKPLPIVAVVNDTSGSMSGRGEKETIVEINSILKVLKCQVTVIDCDTEAHTKKIRRANDALKTKGGGGTDIRVGIEKALSMKPRPNVCVVLTDGCSPWHAEDERARFKGMEVLICICGDHTSTQGMPSYYKVLQCKD